MAEVAQEESTPVASKAVAVEVETEAPVTPKAVTTPSANHDVAEVETEVSAQPTPAAVVAKIQEAVAEASPLKEVATAVEAEVKAVAAKAKRAVKTVVGDAKAIEEKLVTEVSDAEKLIILRMENQFLQITQNITNLQRQVEQIQKQFPEYIKTLAAKYSVDLTKNTFHSVEGVFKKNQ